MHPAQTGAPDQAYERPAPANRFWGGHRHREPSAAKKVRIPTLSLRGRRGERARYRSPREINGNALAPPRERRAEEKRMFANQLTDPLWWRLLFVLVR
jgi:hypothetical protein